MVCDLMLSIRKLMDQFLRCKALHVYLQNVRKYLVYVSVHLFVPVRVYVFMCPTPSILKPMGQFLPATGVEVQFVDCKINVRACLASNSG